MADGSAAALADIVAEAFWWSDAVTIEAGPRGATARIWQVRVGAARYALKEGLGEPPSAGSIAAEVDFVSRAAAAGVRVPRLHADREGRWLVQGPGGSWLRLYDWLDTSPTDLASPTTAAAVGELLARLHRGALPATSEPDGGAPDAWYERPPAVAAFAPAVASGMPWAARLRLRVESMPRLVAIVRPVDPSRLVLCHRDLHPGNVVADGAGGLVVLDQDDLGPADPARELARALFDWWSDPGPDLDRMRSMYRAYLRADGPARVRELADFTMLVASRLNFLLRQVGVARDPAADPDDRAWAEQEIDESLRIMPTAEQLSQVLAALEG